MDIGFIGLGIMGSRMAKNLLRANRVAVWNRSPEPARALAAAGATVAATPADLAASADVVALCVATPAAVEAVAEGPQGFLAGLRPGALVIDFSTVGPATARRLAEACAARDARFLACPVTGSKGGAESGTLVLMAGGAPEAFAAAKPVLDLVGAKAIHVGTVEQACTVKLVGNLVLAHMLEALAEGTTLAARAGVPFETLLSVMQSAVYASKFWDFKGQALAARDFSTNFSVALMHKDLSLALALGQELGVPLPGTATIRELYQQAKAQGLGELDIVATAAIVDPSLAPAGPPKGR